MKTKFCPKCGSKNIIDIRTSAGLIMDSQPKYRCLDCGYEGSIILEETDKKRKKAK